jgi:hypothetical protein
MSNVLLGIIAVSVLTMAVIQVALCIAAARAARRLGAVATRLEEDIRPIVANLQAISADAARTTALAAATVERADRFMHDTAQRIEHLASSIPSLLESARDGFNVFSGVRSILGIIRDRRTASRRRASSVEEEDPLFIG